VNKSDVVQDVSGVAGVSRSDVEKVIDAFFDTVRNAVAKGDRVAWPSFGSFSATKRQARTGRNPRTGEPVPIAASTAVKFSSSTALKSALNPPKGKAAKKSGKAAAPTKSAPAKKSGTSPKSAPPKKSAPAKAAPAKSTAKTPPAKKSTPAKSSAKAPAKKATKARK